MFLQWVIAIAVLPDGRIVSGSNDKTLRIWNSGNGVCLKKLEGHTKVSDVAICVLLVVRQIRLMMR